MSEAPEAVVRPLDDPDQALQFLASRQVDSFAAQHLRLCDERHAAAAHAGIDEAEEVVGVVQGRSVVGRDKAGAIAVELPDPGAAGDPGKRHHVAFQRRVREHREVADAARRGGFRVHNALENDVFPEDELR